MRLFEFQLRAAATSPYQTRDAAVMNGICQLKSLNEYSASRRGPVMSVRQNAARWMPPYVALWWRVARQVP